MVSFIMIQVMYMHMDYVMNLTLDACTYVQWFELAVFRNFE